MFDLVLINGELFAEENNYFAGKVINDLDGTCSQNPCGEDDSAIFWVVYSGQGRVYQQMDNPASPLFIHSWSEVFSNPELLPKGTKNVFLDKGGYAISLYQVKWFVFDSIEKDGECYWGLKGNDRCEVYPVSSADTDDDLIANGFAKCDAPNWHETMVVSISDFNAMSV